MWRSWRRPDGTVVVNPLTFVPADLDWIDVPAYDFMLHAVFKYGSLGDFLPYLELSVIDRTRELGLLRAIGLSRSQTRRMITSEAVIVAVFGALLGIAVGVGFGVALQQSPTAGCCCSWRRRASPG